MFFKLFRRFFNKKPVRNTTSWVLRMTAPRSKKHKGPAPVIRKKGLVWCPFAFKGAERGRTRGTYGRLYPKGAIVHFTAGHPLQSLRDALAWQKKSGMLYFVIAADGSIGQNFPLTHWGYHAGKSSWKGLKGTVSKHLVGIEVCCPGKLSKGGVPSFGSKAYPSKLIRTSEARDNIEAGTYYKFTKAQEESLVRLLKWLKSNNPDVFDYDFVLGHDEVSPGRKNDPGASLSITMPQLRNVLKND